MKKAIDGMSRALFDSDLIATRLALFLAEALWAIMLFWPGDTFDRPTYSEMGKLAPELVWATAFGISAVPAKMHALNMDLGAKLRQIVNTVTP